MIIFLYACAQPRHHKHGGGGNDGDYGDGIGGISAAIDVVTDVQYDTSSHVLQIKTRSCKVIDVEAESDWTTIATAAPCPS